MKEYLVWLDLETTGLDAQYDQVLEIAVCVTRLDSFEPLFTLDVPIYFKTDGGWLIEQVVIDMHAATGLWNVCSLSPHNCQTIDSVLAANFIRLGLDSDEAVCYPAGSNPAFDVGFCDIHFPKFAKFLSHKKFDVRTLKLAYRIQRGVFPDTSHLVAKPAHRAWNDVVTSMNEAAYLLGFPPVDNPVEDVALLAEHVQKQMD